MKSSHEGTDEGRRRGESREPRSRGGQQRRRRSRGSGAGEKTDGDASVKWTDHRLKGLSKGAILHEDGPSQWDRL